VQDEARPDQPRVAKHHREQPDDPLDARLIRKFDDELREVDLCLRSRRRLETDFEPGRPRRPKITQKVGYGRISTSIAALRQLTPQAAACQGREGG